VVGVPSPALQWLLRDFERVSYANQLPVDSSPALVITPGQPDLALAATYRGQNFNLTEAVDWNQFRLVDWFRWLVFRSAPAQSVELKPVILWARVDLFQGSEQAVPTEDASNDQVPLQ